MSANPNQLIPDGNPFGWEVGDVLQVSMQGTLMDAIYEGWSEKYGLPITRVNGVRQYRNAYVDGVKVAAYYPGGSPKTGRVSNHQDAEALTAAAAKKSRFGVNQRFEFIEEVVDMVISGKSNSLIISGSGGLGKSYTVLQRLQMANLVDKSETNHICDNFCIADPDNPDSTCPIGDYMIVKGFSTPKGLYRMFYENRNKILVFDDLDSIWENQTCLNLLKSALDSYDVRRLSWLSELKGEDMLPRTFKFTGRVIFVSNLSLIELDQAVLSRCLYVDVSMTREEKVDRISVLAKSIRPDLSMEVKQQALDLIRSDEILPHIGDLNIRTFLKVLEIRDSGRENWRDVAEYIITAM